MFSKDFTIEDFFFGLSNDWVDFKEVLNFLIINNNIYNISIDDIINVDTKDDLMNLLSGLVNSELAENLSCRWIIYFLLPIKNSSLSIKEKNVLIEQYWVMFEYPDEWKEFIYYMPNNNANSVEDVYMSFENFLKNIQSSCV